MKYLNIELSTLRSAEYVGSCAGRIADALLAEDEEKRQDDKP